MKTGLNEAFIIDNETKDALVAQDPRSAEILKPVLRGRDIQRYRADWRGLWLIGTFPALGLSINDYPAVKRHLLSFRRQRLEQSGKRLSDGGRARKRTGNAWFEVQDTCAYHAEFAQEKLFWIDLTDRGRFAYDADEMFCVNSAYMLTGGSLKYLCAVLNSTLVTWFMQNSAHNSGMGTARWVRSTVERIPVPIVDIARQRPFTQAVDEIMDAERSGADTTDWEGALDGLVCKLYRLTEDEIRATTGRAFGR